MLAGHVDAVLVLIAANHAGVGVGLLTDQSQLDLADVCLVSSNFEHCFVLDLKKLALFAFN